MAYYRRMWSVEEHFGGNTLSAASLRYHLRDLWRSPRGTVLYIEALAMVAIIFSFFLALFGSCRRWSKRWIVQKGFLAAQVLSLSLGTYSIGLMQSSSVKSEMYPIWVVSLFTLFGCIDPVSTNIGFDYKGPLLKMIFQHCLYFGYVMLMTVSTISSDVGKLAIVLLSTITLIKGFHRALAFVQLQPWQEGKRDDPVGDLDLSFSDVLAGHPVIEDILPNDTTANSMTIKDVWISYLFSHQLRKRFFGLDSVSFNYSLSTFKHMVQHGRFTVIDYKRALNVVEVELAFLFEAFFTSSEFLYWDQAKGGSLWAVASLVGICFVGVVAANIPGAMASSINSAATATGGAGAATYVVVGTTATDLIITLVILVSLALLQVVQLIRCWTSNWARVSIACDYTSRSRNKISGWVMGLRMFLVARVNCFDKYLWQAMLGQDTLLALSERERTRVNNTIISRWAMRCCIRLCPCDCASILGLLHFVKLVRVLLFSDITGPGGDVKLHKDVKASIAEFLGTIKSVRIGVEWSALFVENGLQDWLEYLPYTNISFHGWRKTHVESEAYAFARRVMIWHIATCYCEEAEKEEANRGEDGSSSSSSSSREKNRRVAMDLSKYCVYLVVSAPELLHGPPVQTKEALNKALQEIYHFHTTWLQIMQRLSFPYHKDQDFAKGLLLGKRLRNEVMTPPEGPGGRVEQEGEQSTRRPCSSDHWELLALVWVQTLLYAAPYGDTQAHMQRLAQGGEFITHLWALLYHFGIDKWDVADIDELKAGAAAETTTEVQVQEDAGSGVEIEEMNSHRQAPASSLSSDQKGAAGEASREEAGGAVGESSREAGAAQVARKTAQEPREDEIEEVPN